MKHTLSVLVENKPGVLTRISGLFARRGFNIDGLAVGETHDPKISRMTISVDGSFPSTDMVMRDILGSCVSPTARPSILNPRRANNPDIRVSTPGLFSTRTDRVCFILLTPEHVTDGSARRHHGHYVGFPLDPTVYYRRAIDLQGLTKYCFNLFQAFNAIAVGTVRLRQFHKVRLAGHAHVAIALIPKQLLPLSDHP